jgi:hypothetical protein
MRKISHTLAVLLIAASLSGCAEKMSWVQRFEAKALRASAAKACEKAGWGVSDPRHIECVNNTMPALLAQDQANAQRDRENLLSLLALGAAGYAASQGRVTAQPNNSIINSSTTGASPVQRSPDRQASLVLCPDGTYVYGTQCDLAPNGRYLPSPATIAPNGQYVTGRPQIAPDGTYVGGDGPIRICPDGSYVSGARCLLTPNGKYVGAP